jgi:radical SAM protein with 4Fe4S-binding SPASM domain
LNTAEACSIIDKIAEAGCLFLLITGGEPLLRPDFGHIYRQARECGLAVRVFTNGTRVKDDVVQLFREYPPLEVEITLYGSTPEMYQEVTGSENGYSQCLAGIHRLLNAGVRLKLKTVLMRQNQAGLPAMKALADRLGVPFRFDTVVVPTRDGDHGPLACRLPPEAAVVAETQFPTRTSAQSSDPIPQPLSPLARENLFLCGAARTSFAVDPSGKMTPCLLMRGIEYDLLHGTLEEGWRRMEAVCQMKVGANFPCRTCPHAAFCLRCPPILERETGNMAQPPRWLCDLARRRHATRVRQEELL